MTNEQAKVGMELGTEMLQLINKANRMSQTADELSWVTEFVQEGIQHGTIAEAVYFAMRDIQQGHSIPEAIKNASNEWYK